MDKYRNIISTTYPQESSRLKPGQNITIDASAEKESEAYYAVVDGYSYYCGEDFINGYIDESLEIVFDSDSKSDDAENSANDNKDEDSEENNKTNKADNKTVSGGISRGALSFVSATRENGYALINPSKEDGEDGSALVTCDVENSNDEFNVQYLVLLFWS